MEGGSDSEKLRALETRIAEAKARQQPKDSGLQRGFGQGEAAWRMVMELATGMGLGLGLGLGLDTVLGTKPLMTVVFAILGFAAGVRIMMKTAQSLQQRAEDKRD